MTEEPTEPTPDQASAEPKKLTMKELQSQIDNLNTKVDQLPKWVEQTVNQTLETWKDNINQNIGAAIDLAMAKFQPNSSGGLAETVIKLVGDVVPKVLNQGVPSSSTNAQINQFAERIQLSMFKRMATMFDKQLGEAEHVKVG